MTTGVLSRRETVLTSGFDAASLGGGPDRSCPIRRGRPFACPA